MHPLSGALPLPYVPARVTRGVSYRYSFAPLRIRTSQYRRTFAPSQCLFGTILVTPCIWWCGTGWFKTKSQCFHVGQICSFILSPTIFSFSSFRGLVMWSWGLRIDSILTLSQRCSADSFLIIILIIYVFCFCKQFIQILICIIYVMVKFVYNFIWDNWLNLQNKCSKTVLLFKSLTWVRKSWGTTVV